MPYYYGYDWTYVYLVLPCLIFSLWASWRVNGTFKKYSKQYSSRGLTGADAAQRVLRANGVSGVRIERIGGSLTDHYDPTSNVIRLSDDVYGSTSTAAIGVACHEAGHAVQYAQGYAPIKLRAAIIPVTNFGSRMAMPLILLGILFSSLGNASDFFINLGLICFGFSVVFQLVTLPVEFNASHRAIRTLREDRILDEDELKGAKKVLAAAKNKKSATLRLVGNIDDNAKTESFHAILKGTGDTNEAIIINTHTDGCNFSEENGGIGILPMMKYFKAHPTKRTLIFVFVTGHFRLPVFREGIMTSNQATGRWLAENKNLWNGKTYKAVAGVSVEHLGCTEWKDVNGVYTKTNDIDTELVYTGNKNLDKIYYEAIKDRKNVRTTTLRAHNTMHFGEGQPLSKKHIPEIALVTAPDYLCSVDPTGNEHMDKFNLDLMYEQIQTFINCVNLIDGKTRKEIGKSQGMSFGLGKLK